MVDHQRHEWLERRVEAAIDPHRRIIDPHHHLWDRPGNRYLAADLADDALSHHVTDTVFVECSAAYDSSASAEFAPVGETAFVARQANDAAASDGPRIAAIVGHADLTLGPAVEEVLHAHVEAGCGLFRGVRHGTNWSRYPGVKNGHHEPGPHLLSSDAFRSGVATLGALGLSFDAWLYFDQLLELADLAASVPECCIVVDHLGGPLGIGPHALGRTEMIDTWKRGIARVASCENTVLKVGGLGMEHYFGTAWADLDAPPSSEQVAAHWGDMVHFAVEHFGPERCMFESNFPVDRQTLPYAVLWNAFQILGQRYAATEQDDLFFGTAMRTYAITA